ncbi:MAG: glycosyltransferase family 2 protein, partial [Hyphomicrobiales bacterium]
MREQILEEMGRCVARLSFSVVCVDGEIMSMTTTSPRVSLGVPVHNGGPLFAEMLQSLVTQTFTDFEIVISDNASTDDTSAIARRFADRDERVRY